MLKYIVFLVLCLAVGGRAGSRCHRDSPCTCSWKKGKQYAECRSKNLIKVPNNLDSANQILDLSDNNLQRLPRDIFKRSGLVNLQKIYLSNCRLGEIDPLAFDGLTNLVELDLSKNMLTKIPYESFHSIPALRELSLSNNPIQRITNQAFRAVPGLVNVDLSDCQIRNVESHAFDELEILETLKLSGNRLRELQHRCLVDLSRIYNVELHANPWECDCRLRPMYLWLQDNNIPTPLPPVCHGPPRVAGRTFNNLQLDDFACSPELLPMVRRIIATDGENATLTCRIVAKPAPRVSWFWRGREVFNNSRFNRAPQRMYIKEDGQYQRTSQLIITHIGIDDAEDDFRCVGLNSAGEVQTNFSVSVSRRVALMSPLNSGHIAGIAGGLVAVLVILVIVFIFLMRIRHPPSGDKNKSTQNGGGVVNVEIAPEEDVNPVQKPPRLTDLADPPPAYHSTLSPSDPSVFVSGPDLINELDARNKTNGIIRPYYQGFNSDLDDTGSYEVQRLSSVRPDEGGPLPIRDRVDLSIYGYPADYGLPIPEISDYGGDTISSESVIRRPSLVGSSSYSPPTSGYPYPTDSSPVGTPLNSSRDSRTDLNTSRDSYSSVKKKPWQMNAVPVLPPHPNSTVQRVGDAGGTDV